MNFIEARKLVHEFIRRDEDDNVESILTALDGVDLDVKQGEFVAVLGHNGSGKSTLAKHLNVLLTPGSGTLWVDGKDAGDADNLWEYRRAYAGNLEACGKELKVCGHDTVSRAFPQQAQRRAEAEDCHCRGNGDGA